jgi:thiol:disulfide interchange protein DsbA
MKRRSVLLGLFALPILDATPSYSGLRRVARGNRLCPHIPSASTIQPGIEVVEFFSYGCPHCNEFEPAVSKWRASLPKDVHFRRVPIFVRQSEVGGAWKALPGNRGHGGSRKDGRPGVLGQSIGRNCRLRTTRAVIDWAASAWPIPRNFTEMYQSFGIQASVSSAEQMGADFGITGIPSFGVCG